MIKPLLALMFMGQGLHDINVSLNQEKADFYGQFIGTNQNFVLSGFAQEFVVIASAVVTKRFALFQVFFKIKKYSEFRTANSLTNGLALGGIDHLLWKPPKQVLQSRS